MPRRYKDRDDEGRDRGHGHGDRHGRKKKKPKPEAPPAIPREETEEERRELMRRLRRKKKKTTEGPGLSLADRIQVQRKIEEQNRQIQEENSNHNMSLGSLAVSELDAADSRSRLEEVQEEGQGSREVLLTTVTEEDSVAPAVENHANGTLTPVETPEMQRAPDFAPMEPGYYDVTTGCTTQMIDGTVHHVSNRRIRSSSTLRQRCVDLRKTKSSYGVTLVTPKEQTARIRMNEQTTFAGQGNNYQYRSYEEMYVLHPNQRPKTAVIPTRNSVMVRRIQSSKPNLASRELVVKASASSNSKTIEKSRPTSVTMVVSGSSAVNSETTMIIANQEKKKITIDRSHYVDATESKCDDSIDLTLARIDLVQVEQGGGHRDTVVITEKERSVDKIVVVSSAQSEETVEKNITLVKEEDVAKEETIVTKEEDLVAKEVIVIAREEDRVADEVIVVTKEEDRVATGVVVVAKEEDVVAKAVVGVAKEDASVKEEESIIVVAQTEETTKSELNILEQTETDLNVQVVETNSTVVTDTKATEESKEDTKLIIEVNDTTDETIDLWIKESEEKSKEVTDIKTEKSETEEMEKDMKEVVDIKLVADVENNVTVKTDVEKDTENDVTLEANIEAKAEVDVYVDTEANVETNLEVDKTPDTQVDEKAEDVSVGREEDASESQPEEAKDTEEGKYDPVPEPTKDKEESKDSETQSMSNSEVSLHLAVSLDGVDSPGAEPTLGELNATPEPTVVNNVEELPKEDDIPKEEVHEESSADQKVDAVEEEAPDEEVPIEEKVAKDEDSNSPSQDIPKEEDETTKEDEQGPGPEVAIERPLTPKASPPRKRPSTSKPQASKPQLDVPNKPNRHSSLDTRAMEKMIADMEKKVDEDLSSILDPPGAPKPIPAWEKEKNKETMRKILNDEFFGEEEEDLLQGFIKDG